MTTTHTLDVPGARLHYEVRGAGPLLLVMGAPMAAAAFAPLADMLATHTVVTHGSRGISGSILYDPGQDSIPELRADDVTALLDALGAESADVFANGARFFADELRGTTRYLPDIAALAAGPTPVVVGIGVA
ncbi:alpha/beta fold hydrolase [Streptomyces rapamycinicus]|uniref:Alpha/beta hydrolase n=2 Tax=Streptomyces rapamycinicus TaxID=1226757 RepID=A0A0A0NPJ8_STRRN|nr:hypothetical protein [Streptomyces rapamycinicus]AGP61502.1 hypothetical protein M271_50735 [Streptomyces rapamycinicus NRRL 5491]MBB4787299.1 pimeloyl-ACP methyl ester carboxylesterase [Streptomyces rapamycinicus]RLV71647.1 hypothetical protein D3C57_144010 [Streptomyces rapamycinicus NRRL 5491]UTP36952.1 hypothetical protein LIV37_51805 [Streptomyces rapamycinicus NRRL 5491]